MHVSRSRLFAFSVGLSVALLLLFAGGRQPPVAHATATFTVNSALDTADAVPDGVCDDGAGHCTLRAAIMEANSSPASGPYTVNFAIAPIGSMKTISPISALGGLTPLPPVMANITIDGSTQTGSFVGIELSGLACTSCPWGIAIAATSTVKGMVVNDFVVGAGIAIGGPAGGSTITNNFIGTNPAGSSPKPNAAGVVVAASSGNSIGPGNTISGNSGYGVWITSCFPPPYTGCGVASGNLIFSNGIGVSGVCCSYSAVPNGIGVDIDGTSTYGAALAVSGNRVGVSPSGNNKIAGNLSTGVVITGSMATGNSVEANNIGNAFAATAIPNGGAGVCICGASSNVVGPGNNISGNTLSGVLIKEAGGVGATGNTVQNSGIGFNASATGALPNGGSGVEIDGSGTQGVTGNTVGCAALAGCGIGIGGNALDGVHIHGAMASGNLVGHAAIGESCPGGCLATAIPIPNGAHGVYISGGAHDNVVGGLNAALTGNDIGFNHGAGFAVDGGGSRNQIIGTTVHDNDGLGIDLDPIAPVGTAPGSLASYVTLPLDAALTSALYCPPLIGSPCPPGGLVAITGYARGAAPGTYRVDVFFNPTCDPSGYGEGARPILGTWYAPSNATTTDADGNLSGAGSVTNFTSTAGIATLADTVGKPVTSNATLILPTNGATSEYGKCLIVKADSDSDGVEDTIEAPGDGCFSDVALGPGGTTFGCIVNRHGCYVSVVDLPNPAGVVIGNICPGVAPADADISVCGIATVHVIDGGSLTDKCGSFRSGVNIGPLGVDFGPYRANIESHTSFVIEDLLGNQTTFSLQNLPSSAHPIDVVNQHPVLQGTTATFGSAVGGISVSPVVSSLPSAAPPPVGRSGLWAAVIALGLAGLAMAAGARLLRPDRVD